MRSQVTNRYLGIVIGWPVSYVIWDRFIKTICSEIAVRFHVNCISTQNRTPETSCCTASVNWPSPDLSASLEWLHTIFWLASVTVVFQRSVMRTWIQLNLSSDTFVCVNLVKVIQSCNIGGYMKFFEFDPSRQLPFINNGSVHVNKVASGSMCQDIVWVHRMDQNEW